eukprot:SAG22_NODE_2898_length_2117_cov_7.540634_2_plen_208_part_00
MTMAALRSEFSTALATSMMAAALCAAAGQTAAATQPANCTYGTDAVQVSYVVTHTAETGGVPGWAFLEVCLAVLLLAVCTSCDVDRLTSIAGRRGSIGDTETTDAAWTSSSRFEQRPDPPVRADGQTRLEPAGREVTAAVPAAASPTPPCGLQQASAAGDAVWKGGAGTEHCDASERRQQQEEADELAGIDTLDREFAAVPRACDLQ